jgi:hypothetical protein
MTAERNMAISAAQGELGWPAPAVYADAGLAARWRPWLRRSPLAAMRLHVETAIALQIALATGEFRTGRYVRDKWDFSGWRRDEA